MAGHATMGTGRAPDPRFAEARRLIEDANRAGLALFVADDDLHYGGDIASVSDAIRLRLRTLRDDVIAELIRPKFSQESCSSTTVRLQDYWRGWWSELNVNQPLANGTHVVWRLQGARCADRFRAAVAAVVPRHAILSARITDRENVLQIEFGKECTLVGASEAAEGALHQAEKILWAPLRDGTVFRPFLVEISATEVICGFVLHHLVADFYACHLLARELCRHLFFGAAADSEPGGRWLEYSEYVRGRTRWEDGPAGQYRLEYWSRYLDGAAKISLPGAAHFVTQSIAPLQTVELAVDQELRASLTEVATKYAATLAQVLLAAKFVTLAALLGQTDLLVTVIVSGRDDPVLLRFMGNTADCVPMRLEVRPDQSFPCLLEQLQAAYALACRYRVKWELILKARPINSASVVAPTFNFVSAGKGTRAQGSNQSARGGLSIQAVRLAWPPELGSAAWHTSHEMNLFDTGHSIAGSVKYIPARRATESVEKFVQSFSKCLRSVAAHPTRLIAELV